MWLGRVTVALPCAVSGVLRQSVRLGRCSLAPAWRQRRCPCWAKPPRTPRGSAYAHPMVIALSNTITLQVHNVRWKHWGDTKATGTGTGYWLPAGKPYSDARPAPAEGVAFDLGTCTGKRADLKLGWFLPSRGERFTPATQARPALLREMTGHCLGRVAQQSTFQERDRPDVQTTDSHCHSHGRCRCDLRDARSRQTLVRHRACPAWNHLPS